MTAVHGAQFTSVGNVKLRWGPGADDTYCVSISEPNKVVKSWVFKKCPINEVFSFYWYEQACDILRHQLKKGDGIPDVVLNAETEQIEEMLKMAIKTI